MPKNYCIMQIWAESGKSALPICNYSQILYQFLTFTQNLKRSQLDGLALFFSSFNTSQHNVLNRWPFHHYIRNKSLHLRNLFSDTGKTECRFRSA